MVIFYFILFFFFFLKMQWVGYIIKAAWQYLKKEIHTKNQMPGIQASRNLEPWIALRTVRCRAQSSRLGQARTLFSGPYHSYPCLELYSSTF